MIFCGDRQGFAIGTKGDGADGLIMAFRSDKALDGPSRTGVPKLRIATAAGRGKLLSIAAEGNGINRFWSRLRPFSLHVFQLLLTGFCWRKSWPAVFRHGKNLLTCCGLPHLNSRRFLLVFLPTPAGDKSRSVRAEGDCG